MLNANIILTMQVIKSDNLALSVEARYFQALGEEKEIPEDGYHGQDIIELGKRLVDEFGDKYKNV